MRLSFDWLSDYVDLTGLTVQEVADALTMHAFEVEEIRQVGPDIKGPVIVGEILEIHPHPNADKIRLTKVRVSESDAPLDIVCGAQNIEVGQKIPVALPGARVINRHDGTTFDIKATKIRGVASNGMLCSPPELGLTGYDQEGILILNGGTKIGDDAQVLLNLFPDYVLHVEPRSNRGDALSVMGLAREVACILKRPLKMPSWKLGDSEKIEAGSQGISVESQVPEDCPFFTIRTIQGIKIGPSSAKIARRLEAIGVRPVNNVVDITNYVLHELGQPLHAYDARHIEGATICCRRARKDEELITIDGKVRKLTEEVLVIADSKKVLGVAGVMGGKDSEIADDTVDIYLEAAQFNLARVRRSSRLLGLSSDSSLRFERGVDKASVRYAADYAAYLLVSECGGKLGALSFAGSDKVEAQTVSLRLSALKRHCELEISAAEIKTLLAPLGFEANVIGAERIEVSVPSFRQRDIKVEIDLVEEIARLWGYDRIAATWPAARLAPPPADNLPSNVRRQISAQGLSEAWTSSLVPPADIEIAGGDEAAKVAVLNALSPEHQVLRQSLLPGLIRTCVHNQDHGQQDIWLYELGRTYKRVAESNDRQSGVKEELFVAGVMAGVRTLSSWTANDQEKKIEIVAEPACDFYRAKGVVENLLTGLSIDPRFLHFKKFEGMPRLFHPGRSCQISFKQKDKSQVLGYLGQLHPLAEESFGLRRNFFIFELSLEAIAKLVARSEFAEIYATPAVVRDLTVDLAQSVPYQQVYDAVFASAGAMLTDLRLVSVFGLSSEAKSLSFRLTFQHAEKTLTAQEVDERLDAVRKALVEGCQAHFRV